MLSVRFSVAQHSFGYRADVEEWTVKERVRDYNREAKEFV